MGSSAFTIEPPDTKPSSGFTIESPDTMPAGTYQQFKGGPTQNINQDVRSFQGGQNLTKRPGETDQQFMARAAMMGRNVTPAMTALNRQPGGQIVQAGQDIKQGNIAKGLHEGVQAVGPTMAAASLPFVGAAAVTAPLATGGGLVGGVLGQKGAKAGAEYLGATPDQANLAGDIGGVAGGSLGAYGGSKLQSILPSPTDIFDKYSGVNRQVQEAKAAREQGILANRQNYMKDLQNIGQQNEETLSDYQQSLEQARLKNRLNYEADQQKISQQNQEALSDYLSKNKFATQEAAINKAIGSSPKIGMGRSSLDEAGIDAGRGLREEGFNASQINSMNPQQRAQAIAPLWNKAGQEIGDSVTAATEKGTTLDVGKSAFQILKKIPDPALQERAIEVFNDTAHELGIQNLREATPEEARAFRTAIRSHAQFGPGGDLGSMRGIGAQLYRSISSDLHDAVPGLADLDQHYADLNEAMKSNNKQLVRFGAGKSFSQIPPPPTPEQLTVAKYSPLPEQPELKSLNVAKYTPPPAVPSTSTLRALKFAKAAPWIVGGGAGTSLLMQYLKSQGNQ